VRAVEQYHRARGCCRCVRLGVRQPAAHAAAGVANRPNDASEQTKIDHLESPASRSGTRKHARRAGIASGAGYPASRAPGWQLLGAGSCGLALARRGRLARHRTSFARYQLIDDCRAQHTSRCIGFAALTVMRLRRALGHRLCRQASILLDSCSTIASDFDNSTPD
jgi:hypothetical protein